MQSADLPAFLAKISGEDQPGGDPRLKAIVRRIVGDLFAVVEEFQVRPEEFWRAVNWLNGAGRNTEFGLIAPGLGFERLLDILADEADAAAGGGGGTPRAIEGPLYVEGAPLSRGSARLDDGVQAAPRLFMSGRVLDLNGRPIAGAVVDVWHADVKGGYSIFDTSQSPYNLRRRIQTREDGGYAFESIMPSGYGCPPDGSTQKLLNGLGRHGRRPAHIHFFVTAPGMRHLTTQINIAGDDYLHDDFAYATRDDLIPDLKRHADADDYRARGLEEPYYEIIFDFVLRAAANEAEAQLPIRPRVEVA
jgi:catechol 1,2-dioxygenase